MNTAKAQPENAVLGTITSSQDVALRGTKIQHQKRNLQNFAAIFWPAFILLMLNAFTAYGEVVSRPSEDTTDDATDDATDDGSD